MDKYSMEIIKPGRPQAGWSKEFKCTGAGNGDGGCGAKLLVSEYDMYETGSSHQGESERHATFCCQQCGVETDVDIFKVPRMNGARPTPELRKAVALENLLRRNSEENVLK